MGVRGQGSVISDQGAGSCFLCLPSSLKKVAVGRMMRKSGRWSVALARFLFSLARRAAFCFFERSEVLWFTSPPPGEIQRGCIPSAVGWLACFPRPSGRLFWFNNAKRKKSHLTISSHMLLNRLSFIKPYNRPSGVKKQANLTTFEKYTPSISPPEGGDVNHTTSLRL